MAASLWRRVKANAALTWRWFRYWRKRYMWLRLAIIVLIFAEPVYSVFHPVIRELVVIAIKGIEAAKPGPRRYADYYQFEDKKRLQKHLLTHFDANRDGRLERAEAARLRRETGLAPRQVTGSGLRVELDPLLEANRKLKLVPAEVTPRALRREALDRALAEMDRQHKESHAEIDPALAMHYPGWRDYLKWGTWARGIRQFRIDVATGGAAYIPLPAYFQGVLPRAEGVNEFDYLPYVPGWKGYLAWVLLVAVTCVCVRRYGKGEVLRKRLEEDPEFALAPCPICKAPTHDYGALKQHHWARAWASAAVTWLVLVAVTGLRPERLYPIAKTNGLLELIGRLSGARWLILLWGTPLAVGVLRWLLWPREVHAVHRRPWLLTVGFGAGVVLVVGLLGAIASFALAQYRPPRAPLAARGAPPTAAPARPVPRPSDEGGMRGSQRRPALGMRRARGARIQRRGRAQRGPGGERGTRRAL